MALRNMLGIQQFYRNKAQHNFAEDCSGDAARRQLLFACVDGNAERFTGMLL